MSLKAWFEARRKTAPAPGPEAGLEHLNKALWVQCAQCQEKLLKTDYDAHHGVCPKCGYHHRIGARERLSLLTDEFSEMDAAMMPADPLSFEDTEAYIKRQASARKKAHLNDAIVTGVGKVGDEWAALAVMDFAYMGGSMGSVVGEKLTRLIERALAESLPVICVASSGGARMQEGIFSLMQMVKTSSALARLHDKGLFYLTILTEPTFGGVTASYGTLGDIIIAEEGARIGFAGRRVIEQTIRQKLPPDFQTAGYLLNYGQVDQVVKRSEMKPTVEQLLRLHRRAAGYEPGPSAQWQDSRAMPGSSLETYSTEPRSFTSQVTTPETALVGERA